MADINIATDILDSKYIPVISWVKEKYGVFNNDLLVNLYSQWGRSNLLKEADKDYHFQLYSKGTWNANGKRSNPTQPPVVHNLEARDPDFINYILKNIEIGNGENQFLYRPIGNDIEVYGYRGKVFEGTTFILPETLDGHTVVGIGRKAFDRGFTNNVITQVIIPETVTNIDDYAFFGCTDLETISFEGTSQLQRIGAYAFSGCEKLSRFNSQSGGVITIPSAVTELEINAFSGLENVQYVSIPADVSYIGEMAFAFMPKLTSITVASSNANYMSYMGNLYNKDGWLMQYTVGSPATTFSVPTSVSGKTITNIGMYAFAGANRLTVIDFNRVESIGEYAFKDCTSLSSYSGGAGIEYVAAGAFDDTLITGNEKGFWAFGKFLYKYDGNSQIISKDMFPSAVTKIGEFAFLENETLEEVYLPLNVDFIGDYAFAFCNNLKKVQYENFVLPFINNSIFIGLNDEFKFYCAKSLADGIEDNQKWGQYASIVESIKTLAYFEDVNETLTFYYGESTALPTKQVENYYNKGWHEVIGENNGQPVIDTERLGVVTWGRTDAAITYKADLMAIESYNLILRNGPISDEDKALITIQISIGDTYSFSKDGYEINGNYTAFNEVQKDILSHYYYQGIYAPNEFGSIEEAYCHYNGWVLNVNGEIKAIPNSGQWLEYYQQLVMSLCVDWLPVEYSCVCNYNDGSGRSETLTYTYFSDDSFPTITRTDYELQGWQNSSGVILPKLGGFIGNITVTAKWSPHLYTITCKSTTRVIKTIEVKGARNTYVNLPTLTSGYYYVSSWGTHSVNTPYKVEGNITLTAVWKGTEYSIIYKNRMDNVYVRQFSYEYGKVTILDDPYNLTSTITFEGFYRDENFTQSITKISASEHGNITIYIKWKFSCG